MLDFEYIPYNIIYYIIGTNIAKIIDTVGMIHPILLISDTTN